MFADADLEEALDATVFSVCSLNGERCTAGSRVLVERSIYDDFVARYAERAKNIVIGLPSDPATEVGALVHPSHFEKVMSYVEIGKGEGRRVAGGGRPEGFPEGNYVAPTVFADVMPDARIFQEEIFGPVLSIHVYPDDKFAETLQLCDTTSPYGLTGSIFSKDRYATVQALSTLRYAAGNFYINDKPTGAVVGQQPFGGSRQSGTNDKAGSHLNLLRWLSPRTIKETFLPPPDFRYPYMHEKKCGC